MKTRQKGFDRSEIPPDRCDYSDCIAISLQPHARARTGKTWDLWHRLNATDVSKSYDVVALIETMQVLMQIGLGREGAVNSGHQPLGTAEPHLDIGLWQGLCPSTVVENVRYAWRALPLCWLGHPMAD
jgi:hypothetical protein